MVHLPPEVLSDICSCLVITPRPCPTHRDVIGDPPRPSGFTAEDQLNLRTMLNISLASAPLHQAVKPYLYRTITPPMTVSKSLLRALLVSATARLVRNLSTDNWISAPDERYYQGPLPHALVDAAVSNRGLSDDLINDIQRGIPHGRADALLSILLLLCTNLCAWMTSFERDGSDSLVVRTVSQAIASNSVLQHLQDFTLTFAIDDDVASLWELSPVFDAPRLREIRGIGIHLYNDGSGDFSNTPHPNIRQILLAISSINVDVDGLDILLRGCDSLETLSTEFGGPNEDIQPVDDYSSLGHALRHHGTNLLRLSIRRSELDNDQERHRTPLGGLAELTSLRVLNLSFEALHGDETQLNNRPTTWLQENLPHSLELLSVMHVMHSASQMLDEHLRELMNDIRFSALHTVRVLDEEEDGGFSDEEDEDFSEDEDENFSEDEHLPSDVALEDFQRQLANYQRMLDRRT